jgi:hypothetical protein
MISKHVAYEAAHDDYGALARYIADAGHDGEKCLASWCAGCAADYASLQVWQSYGALAWPSFTAALSFTTRDYIFFVIYYHQRQ